MVRIDGVARESRAQRAGILPGDVLVSINGHPVADVLDYRFYRPSGSWPSPCAGERRPILWSWQSPSTPLWAWNSPHT